MKQMIAVIVTPIILFIVCVWFCKPLEIIKANKELIKLEYRLNEIDPSYTERELSLMPIRLEYAKKEIEKVKKMLEQAEKEQIIRAEELFQKRIIKESGMSANFWRTLKEYNQRREERDKVKFQQSGSPTRYQYNRVRKA